MRLIGDLHLANEIHWTIFSPLFFRVGRPASLKVTVELLKGAVAHFDEDQ